ncbi:TetR/AcrR family transcriptional regulator [Sulfurimonas sp. SAG-AH-194-L11]|nr:TetR/AcrR family transcriptional regulator [Sulfurimonas sp. SAG-AH-194-L11]MDF1876240.1 TetR/AcrR family transcriptional regulator [Sulfurimonas sp. SAG-AH-194-L11]
MSTHNNSSYHHGNLKEGLIEEALKMLESEGLSSITLRELTKRLGTSRSALYRHYSSKEELLKAVIQAGFKRLDTYVFASISEDLDIQTKIYTLGRAYINFAMLHPNIYRMIFGNELEKHREESCDIKEREDAPSFHSLVDIIKDGHEKNILKKEDAFMQATVLWAILHGLSNLLIDGHVHIADNIDRLYELSFKTMLDGMALK